jgi:hypothetical protein
MAENLTRKYVVIYSLHLSSINQNFLVETGKKMKQSFLLCFMAKERFV